MEKIAINTYQSNPEGNNWNKEYLTWFKQAIKEKQAPGYGIIPNNVIRNKITEIAKKEIENFKITEQERQKLKKEKQEYTIVKTYVLHHPEGGEDGQNGYFDADIRNNATGNIVRVVARNVFDFGFYTYPKRVEGTNNVFNSNNWIAQEKNISDWLYKFPPFTSSIRM